MTSDETRTVWAKNYGTDERFSGQTLLTRLGYIALGWPGIGDLTDVTTLEQIRAALVETEVRQQIIGHDSGIIYRFRSEAQIGDIVVASCKDDGKHSDRKIYIGTITGSYEHNTSYDKHLHHLRKVKWCHESPPGLFSKEALKLLQTQGTFWRISDAREFLQSYRLPAR